MTGGVRVKVFTVGHGARTNSEFQDALTASGITTLADVRRFPGSRRHPHFAREQLERSLPTIGVTYEMWGETLGGRRKTQGASRHIAWRNDSFRGYADYMDTNDFRDAVLRLEELAGSESVAVMCAETLWWRCHRRLISDALALRDGEVVHILKAGDLQPHKLHPQVRVDESGWPVYDVGETPSLI